METILRQISKKIRQPFHNVPIYYRVIVTDTGGGETMTVYDPFPVNVDPEEPARDGWQGRPRSETKRLHIVIVKTRGGKFHANISYYVFTPDKKWKCIHEHALNDYDNEEQIFEVVNFFGQLMYFD